MRRTWHWVFAIIICAGVGLAANAYGVKSSNEPEPYAVQDVSSLDRRISLFEQRLYSIESRISRLEQQALASARNAPTQTRRDPETDALRSEVEQLKNRARELECGLVHLDERTMSASAKDAQRRTGAQSKDPCRLNPETPVRLSMRP